jgi:hypothetical protein
MKMQIRAGLTAVALTLAMGLAGCGHYTCSAGFGASTCNTSGGGTGTTGNGIVYTYLLAETGAADGMAADSLNLSANSFDQENSFVAPPLPSGLPADGGTVVVNLPGQTYFYAPFDNGSLYGWAINGTTGALTAVAGSPYAVSGGNAIAATPSGTYLFVSDFATGEISAFSINASTGALTAVAGSPFPSGIAAAQMTTDGQGKYLYITTGFGGGAQIAALSIDSGVLSTVAGSPFNFGVSIGKILGENSGEYLVGISGVDSNIYVFGITAGTGVLASGTAFATASIPINIAVNPTGTFVYAFDGLSTPMEGYGISASGVLTAVAGSPFTGVNLNAGQFDQSGLYLFGTAQGEAAIDFGPYGVDTSTGQITALTYELGGFPGGSFAVSDLTDAP